MSKSMMNAPRDETKESKPTMGLRWNNGILEQAWSVITYQGGVAAKQETEWRPVPEACTRGGTQRTRPALPTTK